MHGLKHFVLWFSLIVDKDKVFNEFSIKTINQPIAGKYDAVILAVAHDEYRRLSLEQINDFGKDIFILYDIKHLLNANEVDGRL